MPSKKQRRRREKLQRHEWEYVVETEEGEEVPVEGPPRRGQSAEKTKDRQPLDRRGRPVPKPSLQRVLKRTAIFAPLLLIVVFWTGGDSTTSSKIFTVVLMLAFFLPFSYMVDTLVYRAVMRRQAKTEGR